jgi:nucleotide-binding universal stress UspA family protein
MLGKQGCFSQELAMFKRMLVTLDGSPFAEAALEPAFAMAEKFRSEVVLVQVVMPAELAVTAGQGTTYYDLKRLCEQQECEAAGRYLRRIRGEWLASGVTVRAEVAVGPPPATIIALASRYEVGLIVMSTHGRSGLSRLIYGSVAEAVLRGAQVPVLLVPIR